MSDRLFELEKKAMHHEEMPQGLTQSEQLFYLSMVKLYELWNSHTYDRKKARNTKQELISARLPMLWTFPKRNI